MPVTLSAAVDSLAIGAIVGLPAAVTAGAAEYLASNDLRRAVVVAVVTLAGGLVGGIPAARLVAGRVQAAVAAAAPASTPS